MSMHQGSVHRLKGRVTFVCFFKCATCKLLCSHRKIDVIHTEIDRTSVTTWKIANESNDTHLSIYISQSVHVELHVYAS